MGNVKTLQNNDVVKADGKEEPVQESEDTVLDHIKEYFNDIFTYAKITHRSGGEYLPLTVNYVGSINIYIPNTVSDIQLEGVTIRLVNYRRYKINYIWKEYIMEIWPLI